MSYEEEDTRVLSATAVLAPSAPDDEEDTCHMRRII
jgi:hypothetical protein